MKLTSIQNLPTAFRKALRGILRSLPVILTVILLVSLLRTYLPPRAILGVFGFSPLTDTFLGAFFGSILAGNSINSYIIGEELLNDGVPLTAVSAFLASWVIVGIAQLPAESAHLGTKFASLRALIGFLFSVAIGVAVAFILGGSIV